VLDRHRLVLRPRVAGRAVRARILYEGSHGDRVHEAERGGTVIAERALLVRMGEPAYRGGSYRSYEPVSVLSEGRVKELAAVAALLTVIAGMALRLAKPRQREILTQEASRT